MAPNTPAIAPVAAGARAQPPADVKLPPPALDRNHVAVEFYSHEFLDAADGGFHRIYMGIFSRAAEVDHQGGDPHELLEALWLAFRIALVWLAKGDNREQVPFMPADTRLALGSAFFTVAWPQVSEGGEEADDNVTLATPALFMHGRTCGKLAERWRPECVATTCGRCMPCRTDSVSYYLRACYKEEIQSRSEAYISYCHEPTCRHCSMAALHAHYATELLAMEGTSYVVGTSPYEQAAAFLYTRAEAKAAAGREGEWMQQAAEAVAARFPDGALDPAMRAFEEQCEMERRYGVAMRAARDKAHEAFLHGCRTQLAHLMFREERTEWRSYGSSQPACLYAYTDRLYSLGREEAELVAGERRAVLIYAQQVPPK